jgi:hypothetical protein
MATTYTLISSVTVGSGGAASMEFTSIPATYTDLVVNLSTRNNAAGNYHNLDFRMNGLSTSIYSAITVYGQGTGSASTGSETNQAEARRVYAQANGATANTFGNILFYIPNYTSSNNKSVSVDYVSETNATDAIAGLTAVLMASTSAITSLSFFDRSANNFNQYSTAYLYGISNA